MPAEMHDFDLAGLRLHPGEGRRLEEAVRIEGLQLGGERYQPEPAQVPVRLEVSRMTGGGYALRLSFQAQLRGPCMRCLKDAHPQVEVDSREVDSPGGGEQLSSPYVRDQMLDLSTWAHDAFALSTPPKVLCSEDCAGLCPLCAVDLNEVGPSHQHERAPDPRWAKLRELHLE
jgi:DUF177 domain-containing protein